MIAAAHPSRYSLEGASQRHDQGQQLFFQRDEQLGGAANYSRRRLGKRGWKLGLIGVVDNGRLVDEMGAVRLSDEATKDRIVRWRAVGGKEEELYADCNFVRISCMGELKQSFSVDYTIRDAMWFRFIEDADSAGPSETGIQGPESVVTMGFQELDVFTEGYQLSLSLPFKALKTWPSKFGLLFQRHLNEDELSSDSETGMPMLYSLSHPLNEFLPVLYKPIDTNSHSHGQYIRSGSFRIVKSFISPSIVMIYDRKSGLHSVWHLKKATLEQAEYAVQLFQRSFFESALAAADGTPDMPCPSSQGYSARFGGVGMSCGDTNSNSGLMPSTATGSLPGVSSFMPSHSTLSPIVPSPLGSASEDGGLGMRMIQDDSPLVQSSRHIIETPTNLKFQPNGGQAMPGGFSSSISKSGKFGGGNGTTRQVTFTPQICERGWLKGESPCVGTSNSRPASLRSFAGVRSQATIRMGEVNGKFRPMIRTQSPMVGGNSPNLPGTSTPVFRPEVMAGRRLRHGSFHREDSRGRSFASMASGMSEASFYWPGQPLVPDVCLEHIWTEHIPMVMRTQGTPASRIASECFYTEDFSGQKFLCYLVESTKELRCVKAVTSGQDAESLTLGSLTTLPAKQALFLEIDHLTLVLNWDNDLVLYSGITKIGFVHLNLSSLLHQMKDSTIASDERRRLPLTSTRYLSDLNLEEEESFCVGETSSMMAVTDQSQDESQLFGEGNAGLADCIASLVGCVGRSFFLELITGDMVKSGLPPFCKSKLVSCCLEGLISVLPKEVSLSLACQWYLVNNAPTRPARSSEWKCMARFLLELCGIPWQHFDVFAELTTELSKDTLVTVSKRRKRRSVGTISDFEELTSSDFNGIRGGFRLLDSFGMPRLDKSRISHSENRGPSPTKRPVQDQAASVDASAEMFQHIPTVFFALHLIYQEAKLQVLISRKELKDIACVLLIFSRILGLDKYTQLYERDFDIPSYSEAVIVTIPEKSKSKLRYPSYWNLEPFDVFHFGVQFFNSAQVATLFEPPVYLLSISEQTVSVLLLYWILSRPKDTKSFHQFIKRIGSSSRSVKMAWRDRIQLALTKVVPHAPLERNLLACLTVLGLDVPALVGLPGGVVLPFLDVLYRASVQQELWMLTPKVLSVSRSKAKKNNTVSAGSASGNPASKQNADLLNDPVLRLRFPNDLRVAEVEKMLDSSTSLKIFIKSQPGMTADRLRDNQEKFLLSGCMRTTAQPIGRGMLTMFRKVPLMAELLSIPPLCLSGRVPPLGTTVELSTADTAQNIDQWPQFHNGVASALQIVPPKSLHSTGFLDSAWIVYNMPKTTEVAPEKAGFVFGLGLSGHLANLGLFNIHEYLARGDPLMGLALLLGTSISKAGSRDVQVMKTLSIHLPFLLPPTLIELNVDPLLQIGAVIGLGILHCRSGHLMLSEALLDEIGKPPGPGVNGDSKRECYALACGMALGWINLAQKNTRLDDIDSTIADELLQYLVGGYKRSSPGQRRNRRASGGMEGAPEGLGGGPASNWGGDEGGRSGNGGDAMEGRSEAVMEGEQINVDVSSPAASIALGLIFLKSNSATTASWLATPPTLALLEHIRSDFHLLRTLARSLIMWDHVRPQQEWVLKQIPEFIREIVRPDGSIDRRLWDEIGDQIETVCETYAYLVAGACMAVGIKFAGSANEDAFKLLIHYVQFFMRDSAFSVSGPDVFSIMGAHGDYLSDACCNAVLVALGMVMSGTGNLDVLRIVRRLRQRVTVFHSDLHASHVASHITLGLLFLGGGRYSLKTSNEAVAALLCAFYPKFPNTTNDNRYHLQALRHLYTMAAEPRLLNPVDSETGESAGANLCISFQPSYEISEQSFVARSPYLLPELRFLKSIRVDDPRYWPVEFSQNNWASWTKLQNILASDGTFIVRRRAGFLSYIDDPTGFKSTGSVMFPGQLGAWKSVTPGFSDELSNALPPGSSGLSKRQSLIPISNREFMTLQKFCKRNECLFALPFLAQLHSSLITNPVPSVDIWQLRLISAYLKSYGLQSRSVLNSEFILHLEADVLCKVLAGVHTAVLRRLVLEKEPLDRLLNRPDDCGSIERLAAFLGLPSWEQLSSLDLERWYCCSLHHCQNEAEFSLKLTEYNCPVQSAILLYNLLKR